MARRAASFSNSGAGKLGNPWARLIERCSRANRVIPRMTDSRKPWVRRAVSTAAPLRCAWVSAETTCRRRDGIPAIYLGQEIWAPDAIAVRRVVHRRDVGLPGKFLLVEFGFDLHGTHNDVIKAVLDAGRQIVIAHPERYRYLPGVEPLDVMGAWQELGALLQVNVGSLNGHYQASSPGSEQLAWEMVRAGLIDVLATDHHGPRRSGVSPLEVLNTLIARGEQVLAERAMSDIP